MKLLKFLLRLKACWVITLSLATFVTGCDSLCKKQIEDVVAVQNLTGRTFSISICAVNLKREVNVVVAQHMNLDEISLGTREQSEVKGGPSVSCDGVSDEQNKVQITLAPLSYGSVKLCVDSTKLSYVIVESYQICPSFFQEQLSSVPCNLTQSF